MDVAHERAVDVLAEEIAQRVDGILGARHEPLAEQSAAEGNAVTATCSCGSGIPAMRLRIADKTVEMVALPVIFGQCRDEDKSPDELFDAVKVYNSIPADRETAYREAILRAYTEFVRGKGNP